MRGPIAVFVCRRCGAEMPPIRTCPSCGYKARRHRRRDVAGWCVAFAASCVVGVGEAHAAYWTVPRLVAHAEGRAENCQVAREWGRKQIECAALVVNKDRPRRGREAFQITRCETGDTLNRWIKSRTGRYLGLGQFSRATWNALPRAISRHSVFSPPWVYRAMRHLRDRQGSWRYSWPTCGRRV